MDGQKHFEWTTKNGEWDGLSEAYFDYSSYDNGEANQEIYGNLYNFYAVEDERGICPEGWVIPSPEDINILEEYLGGGRVGGMMKDDSDYWDSSNGGTNISGFSALPGGSATPGNQYSNLSQRAYFWLSKETDEEDIVSEAFVLRNYSDNLYHITNFKYEDKRINT